MRALVFAVGNPLRADDGVARLVTEALAARDGVRIVEEMQLAPEMAETMAQADLVIVVDADPDARTPRLEPAGETDAGASTLSHSLNPATLVAMARRWFQFQGQAWICHVPARDFTLGAPLTAEAESGARAAAIMVEELLEAQCTKPL